MVTSDESAVLALTMFQTLRYVGTKVPHLALMVVKGGRGSIHCEDEEWKKQHNSTVFKDCYTQGIPCGSQDAILEEIISERFIERFKALGVELIPTDLLERNQYTKDIPRGTHCFLGAALSKLLAFKLTVMSFSSRTLTGYLPYLPLAA
jgi:hypothetical protein